MWIWFFVPAVAVLIIGMVVVLRRMSDRKDARDGGEATILLGTAVDDPGRKPRAHDGTPDAADGGGGDGGGGGD